MSKSIRLCVTVCLSMAGLPLLFAGPAFGDTFQDFSSYLTGPSGGAVMTLAEFDGAQKSLARQFDEICGDTFCEGEFGNLTPLGLHCSVGVASGQVVQCAWEIAGLSVDTDPATGHLTQHSKVFACDLGLAGSPADLAGFLRSAVGAATLTGDEGLAIAIPGSGKTLMDVLRGCL